MKRLIIVATLLLNLNYTFAQSAEAGSEKEAIKQYAKSEYTIPAFRAVRNVLTEYKTAIENLNFEGTERLFTNDSQIFESGSSEGTYSHYKEHHLVPEFKDFTSFKYSDYKVNVKTTGDFAFTIETYIYTLVLAKNQKEYKRMGVTTSVLQKIKGVWKIMISHNSSGRL